MIFCYYGIKTKNKQTKSTTISPKKLHDYKTYMSYNSISISLQSLQPSDSCQI